MKGSRWLAFVACVAGLALVGAACGDVDEGDEGGAQGRDRRGDDEMRPRGVHEALLDPAHGMTVTFTKPFVQQHCAWPAPETPDASFARTRRRY